MLVERETLNFTEGVQASGRKAVALATAEKDPNVQKLGQGKGLTFSFMKNETIIFPTIEEAIVSFKSFNNTDVMYICGYSQERKRYVSIPVSTFRRIPAKQEEIATLYDNELRPLNCELAEFDSDLQRFRRLCEVGAITCVELFPAHGATFYKDADGKIHRDPDNYKDITVPVVMPAE